jgi:hypothetical protein
MSKISLEGNAAGTGTFTIASPNSNTSRTLTLPDLTGTVLTNATPGSVLQVVSVTYSTETIIASTSYTDTGLSATITPISASSKILVLVNQQGSVNRSSNAFISQDARILRGSTAIFTQVRFNGGRAGLSGSSDVIFEGSFDGVYLDSPNTTSSITYKTQGKVSTTDNGGNCVFQTNSASSTIALMEIAA